jgi:hypothetical protein
MRFGTITPSMTARSFSSRLALWAAVCTLLLKAAVPMLASAAAGLQGRSVAQVCTVYGVALPVSQDAHAGHHAPAQHHADHDPDHEHDSHALASHSGDHCALTALAALAMPDTSAGALPPPCRVLVAGVPIRHEPAPPDDCARWAARLKHGPPALA